MLARISRTIQAVGQSERGTENGRSRGGWDDA